MNQPQRFLVFHTAFIGDVILALPLVQVLHDTYPSAEITVVAAPAASEVLAHHPAITRVVVYDKRGLQRGVGGIIRMVREVRSLQCDTAVIPHRSLRSALVCFLARIPVRIGFRRSAGKLLLTRRVPYLFSAHEIERNLSLLKPLGIDSSGIVLPSVYPSEGDRGNVDLLLHEAWGEDRHRHTAPMLAIAPGSVWHTKRWPEEGFVALIRLLLQERWNIVLIGGEKDTALCGRISAAIGDPRLLDASGRLSLLQSAALISRAAALVTNDSAPMHLAVAMRTPLVALFGPTVPAFGFAPVGPQWRVVETSGLSCRPCAIHGGKKCPIGTFECMKMITPARVRNEVCAVARRNA